MTRKFGRFTILASILLSVNGQGVYLQECNGSRFGQLNVLGGYECDASHFIHQRKTEGNPSSCSGDRPVSPNKAVSGCGAPGFTGDGLRNSAGTSNATSLWLSAGIWLGCGGRA